MSPWRREWLPTPVFLPGKFHGQRSLVGCSPRGCRVGHYWATKPPPVATRRQRQRTKIDRYICIYESKSKSRSVVSDSLQPHRLYSPWNSPGQNTGVGSLSLLQGIFPTQGSNSGLPHCRQILYQLNHKGIYTKIYMCVLVSLVISHSLRPHGLWPAKFLCLWNSRQEYWSG